MKNRKRKMEEIVTALRGTAHGIAASIDDESITSEQVFSILNVIADSLGNLIEDKRRAT